MTPRRRIGTTGERGKLVRYFVLTHRGTKKYVVQWGSKGSREQESWPFTPEGKKEAETFFKAFGDELKAKRAAEPMTARALWEAFLAVEGPHLRPKSRKLYSDAWRQWEQFYGPTSIAEAVTVQQMAEFRKSLDDRNLATATVKVIIGGVRIVYNFGERMELIARNRWHLFVYKVAKERRTQPRAEYRSEEFLRIWAALNPDSPAQWRAWVTVGLLGIYGSRQNELLQLEWSWIDGDHVQVPPAVVKTGDPHELTLFPLTRQIIEVARRWREKLGYAGAYVIFTGQAKGRPHQSKQGFYSIQSFTDTLHRAEKRAGVESIKWRAGHGFRRGLVGDLADDSGDVMLALQAIGDRDVKMAPRYRVRRNDRVDAAVQERASKLLPEGVK